MRFVKLHKVKPVLFQVSEPVMSGMLFYCAITVLSCAIAILIYVRIYKTVQYGPQYFTVSIL